jgi:hypothetical protein
MESGVARRHVDPEEIKERTMKLTKSVVSE